MRKVAIYKPHKEGEFTEDHTLANGNVAFRAARYEFESDGALWCVKNMLFPTLYSTQALNQIPKEGNYVYNETTTGRQGRFKPH